MEFLLHLSSTIKGVHTLCCMTFITGCQSKLPAWLQAITQTAGSICAACHAGATALGKLHLVSLAAPEEAEREGDRSLPALSTCLQVS